MTASDSAPIAYRRSGRSGLLLPPISLGLWQGTGSYVDEAISRRIIRTAFEAGITHFDLANNYGNPPGASEALFGRALADLPRHEIVVATKAGYRMWPGPYGDGGSRKYLIESCDQSLRRLGLDHVDLFYHHRYDPETPLEESLGALEHLVRQGKALYAGISNYADPHFSRALAVIAPARVPITIHQTRYHLLARDAERTVLPTAGREGVGVAAFSPLAQGLLTGRYLQGIPADSRAALGQGNGALTAERIAPDAIDRVRRLAAIAQRRGQSLTHLALAWILRDPRVTTVIIGASRPEQVTDCLGALRSPAFSADELAEIDVITK